MTGGSPGCNHLPTFSCPACRDKYRREKIATKVFVALHQKPMMFVTSDDSALVRIRSQFARDAVASADALIAELNKT